jgi:MOSC domain-containing protein YiiM
MRDIPILSINIADEAQLLVSDHQSARSAFKKTPISSEIIELGMESLKGDMVLNKRDHGGNDKAMCCYNSDHFSYWEKQFGFKLDNAAFGENLTLYGDSAMESKIYIGDRYALGEAIVEVSEPRGPCYMIGIRYNFKEFPLHLQQTGYTGFYLRTIKPGVVKTTDKLVHLYSHPEKISVMDVNYVRYHDSKNIKWLKRLFELDELTLDWRQRFKGMLSKL